MSVIQIIAQSIAKLLQPHAEVVLYDLMQQRIVAIYNPFSERQVGDDSLMSELGDAVGQEDVIGPYQKTNWDGRKIKSISTLIRDQRGKPQLMLCINIDVSRFVTMQQWLNDILHSEMLIAQPAIMFEQDWQEKINQQVHAYLQHQQWVLEHLSRSQKKKLIQQLDQQGVFKIKNAASYIARVLMISRASVYNYLREVNNEVA